VDLNDQQKEMLSVTAQSILDARQAFPNSSLATLYDINSMPSDLRKAHQENDKAVIKIYGLKSNSGDTEILTKLFEMYSSLLADSNPPTLT
jgi:hypothetical protein